MVWNPADFGGIEQIVVRAEDVWTPDILLYNRLLIYRPCTYETYILNHFSVSLKNSMQNIVQTYSSLTMEKPFGYHRAYKNLLAKAMFVLIIITNIRSNKYANIFSEYGILPF